VIYESQTICQQRISSALTCFQDCNRLSPIECDLIETELKDLIAKPSVREAAKNYSRKDRLDHFWRKILKTYECSELLTDFIHSVLILSHGNSFVERGFSINKEMVIENQLPSSLVGMRQVYDGVQAMGGLDKVVVTKKMINKVRLARSEYARALEEKKET